MLNIIFGFLATKPLLHQIESLRASVQNQQANFERVEQSLFDKLGDFVIKFHLCFVSDVYISDPFLFLIPSSLKCLF